MSEHITKTFHGEVEKINEETRELTIIGSQEITDRYGDQVRISGISTKNYKRNPVVLLAHENRLPIGRANRVWKRGDKLMFKIEFAPPETYSVADTVYKLYRDGFMHAFSIGFIPDKDSIEHPKEKTKGKDKNLWRIFGKSELLEVSTVAVPANPAALVEGKSFQEPVDAGLIDDIERNELILYLQGEFDDEITKEVIDLPPSEITEQEPLEAVLNIEVDIDELKSSDELMEDIDANMDIMMIEQEIKEMNEMDDYIMSLFHDFKASPASEDDPKDDDSVEVDEIDTLIDEYLDEDNKNE